MPSRGRAGEGGRNRARATAPPPRPIAATAAARRPRETTTHDAAGAARSGTADAGPAPPAAAPPPPPVGRTARLPSEARSPREQKKSRTHHARSRVSRRLRERTSSRLLTARRCNPRCRRASSGEACERRLSPPTRVYERCSPRHTAGPRDHPPAVSSWLTAAVNSRVDSRASPNISTRLSDIVSSRNAPADGSGPTAPRAQRGNQQATTCADRVRRARPRKRPSLRPCPAPHQQESAQTLNPGSNISFRS